MISPSVSRSFAWLRPLLVGVVGLGTGFAQSPETKEFVEWGRETMTMIDSGYWMRGRNLYSEDSVREGDTYKPGRQPAFMWGCGVMLSALAMASHMEPSLYEDRMLAYTEALKSYWSFSSGIRGYDVLPRMERADRYYDDNAWMVLAFLEVYQHTRDRKFLKHAEEIMEFVLSGGDDKLGGGLYWRELEKESKNTCTNAPAITGLLMLYGLTKQEKYMEAAQRLYPWTCKNLQDPEDGLFWDHIKLNGEVDKRKFSYNSALMIRANCLIYQITKREKYLDEAKRIGHAAIRHWVKPDGAIADGAAFGHLLLGSFVQLARLDKDPVWRDTVFKCVRYVHDKVRNADGRYGDRWDRPTGSSPERFKLLDEASVARAYWEAAVLASQGSR